MAYNKLQHLQDNIEALRTVFELEKSSSLPNTEQRQTLVNYSGFGGLSCILLPCEKPGDVDRWRNSDAPLFPHVVELYELLREVSPTEKDFQAYHDSLRQSILTSFYTPPAISDAIASSLYEAGVQVGHVLEPSAGVGAFMKTFKKYTYEPVYAYENDLLTGKILRALYPEDKIHIQEFETIATEGLPAFDLITSNIPFGNFAVYDPVYSNGKDKTLRNATKTIHTYFFAKSVDLLREGGLVAFITSRGVMDTPSHENLRRWMMEQCHLVSAVRLPDNLFVESANVEVGSDLIILQKNSAKRSLSPDEEKFIKSRILPNGVPINNYHMDFSRVVHKQAQAGTDRYGKPAARFYHGGGIEQIAGELSQMLRVDLHDNLNLELYKKEQSPHRTNVDVAVSGEPLISLFDLMGLTPEERTQVESLSGRKRNRKPKKILYDGPKESFYKDSMLVFFQEQPGFLKEKTGESVFQPLEVNPDQYDRIRDYIEVRNSYLRLYGYEADHTIENPLLRETLNRDYQSFVSRHGDLNSRENHRLFLLDSFGREVLSLEYFVNGEKQLADIFQQPVSFQKENSLKITDPQETLASSLNLYGYIDLEYMMKISGKEEKELLEALSGQIYYNPFHRQYEIKAQFINGDVLEKAEKLETFLTEKPDHPFREEIRKSIDALRASLPMLIPYEDLDFNLGERWIPVGIYEKFASELFDTQIRIDYLADMDMYYIEADDEQTIAIKEEYALYSKDKQHYNGLYILSLALLDILPQIKRIITDEVTGEHVQILDVEANRQAIGLIVQIREEFLTWLDKQPLSLQNELVTLYNRIYNSRVRPHFDGSFQTFPDLQLRALGIEKPYDSQKDAVWMVKVNEGGIVDHDMGGGKTLIMCISAYELKRLRICHKPMIVCIKNNVLEVAEKYRLAYPNAKVLAPTEKDFEPRNRKQLFDRIKNSNWDTIIVSQEQFKKIPQSIPMQIESIHMELDSLDENLRIYEELTGRSCTPKMEKGLERQKKNLNAKLKRLQEQINQKKDDVITFDQMGIDHLLVDEFHFFKNLLYTTRHSQVSGLGNPAGSERAFNLLQSIRTIQDKKDKDLCVTGLSGTMIANSLVELYLIFKYFRPRALAKMGIKTFDAWAAVFARKSMEYEYTITQEIKLKDRFRYFIKLPELCHFYAEITDYRSAKDLNLDVPKVDTELVVCRQTPEQKEFIDRLVRFAETKEGHLVGREKLTDNEKKAIKLIVTDLGRKAALDMRLIDRAKYHDHPQNKLSEAARRIAELYYRFDKERATQFVFFDLGVYQPGKWNCYTELKRKLTEEYRIPAKEIRAIQEAKNTDQRNQMIAEMKLGNIRIMVGGSQNLGTGSNAQDFAIAGHHITIPYRPCDLEQPRKRYERTGNRVAKQNNNTVYSKIYVAENSLDLFILDLNRIKSGFINQVRSNRVTGRMIDEGAFSSENDMNFGEYIARLSGNQEFMEKSRLEKIIQGMQDDYKIHKKTLRERKLRLEETQGELKKAHRQLTGLQTDVQSLSKIPLDPETGTRKNDLIIQGKSYPDDESRGMALLDIRRNIHTGGRLQKVGSLAHFDILVQTEGNVFPINSFYIRGKEKYGYNKGELPSTPVQAARCFLYVLEQLDKMVPTCQEKIRKLESSVAGLEKLVDAPWKKEKELLELKMKLKEVTDKMEDTFIQEDRKKEPSVSTKPKSLPPKAHITTTSKKKGRSI